MTDPNTPTEADLNALDHLTIPAERYWAERAEREWK